MAILDFISKQFIDIIEWTDDSRDTLSFRFPDEDKEIKRGAQLIVRESQIAQFVYLGQFGDTFGPGKYTLTTDNIPVLSDLKGWKYGLESPFKADVYYVATRLFTGNKWGTANPIMMRAADFGIERQVVRIGESQSIATASTVALVTASIADRRSKTRSTWRSTITRDRRRSARICDPWSDGDGVIASPVSAVRSARGPRPRRRPRA